MNCHSAGLLLIVFLSIQPAYSQYEKYRVREVGEDDGLVNPKVLSICTDRYGYIWMGTEDGINRFDGLNFREYKSGEESGLPSVKMVTNLFLDSSGTLWCISDNRFISTYRYEEDRFLLIKTIPERLAVTDLLIDDSLNIWIGTQKGLYILKKIKQDYSVTVFNRERALFSNQFINKIYRQRSDLFWLCTDNGLFRLRIAQRDTLISRYYYLENPPLWENSINSIISDINGNYWLAATRGFLKQYPEEVVADTGQHRIDKHEISPSPMLFHWVDAPFRLAATNFVSISYDNKDALFLKTYMGLFKYDIQSGEWSGLMYLPDINFTNNNQTGNLRTLFYNSSDMLLWVSTNNGLGIISTSKAEFELEKGQAHYADLRCPSERMLYLYKDTLNRKYAAYCTSMEYLYKLNCLPSTRFVLQDIDTLLILPYFNKFLTTKEDENSYCWFIAEYLGVIKYLLKNDTLFFKKSYNKKDGLPDDFFIDITDDEKGRLWITTLNALSCFDPRKEIFYNFADFRNLRDNRFNAGSYRDENGKIHFPILDGRAIIDPDELLSLYVPPLVVISRVYNTGKSLRPDGDGPIEPAVTKSCTIRVPYRNNDISIELGNLNFFDPNSCIFMYKMDGMDKDWKNNRENRNISYGSLRRGKYSFHAVAVRKDGRTESEEAGFKLIVTPAFYQRTFFYPLIIILILIALFAIIKMREKNLRARAAYLENEVREKTARIVEHSAEMEKMKNRFYTNISHEFRTPLTLINSSAREIVKDPGGENIHKFTGTIFKSSGRLLRLVNELLDLSKLEAGKMDLKVVEEDLAAVVRLVYQNYISDAERRGIKYSFRSDPDTIICWFDRELIHKIAHNLISNALKFTPAGRQVLVEVNLYKDGNGKTIVPEIPGPQAAIIVKDTGKGINPEHLSKIFDRFYQADSSSTREYEGTGIGLAIVHEMTARHYGKVFAESREGEGSEFTVIIPAGKSNYRESELRNETADFKEELPPVPLPPGEKKHKRIFWPGDSGKQIVLVVEDNDDLREFMADSLSKKFSVAEATNGKDGLEKAVELMPDIIVSDIMMPEVNGVDLCAHVKNNNMTCHIPVILLTARADIESRLEGLKTGADDYLTKPFNEEELTVRIDNLLLLRRKLREKFISSSLASIPGIRTGYSDETMIKELLKAIETNMIKSSFTLDDFAMELGLGKRSLQRKIKSLTGLNPVDFIKMVKIKLAAAMIAERKATVSEAAYATGFTSLSHFTKSFRNIVGMNPSEYRRTGG